MSEPGPWCYLITWQAPMGREVVLETLRKAGVVRKYYSFLDYGLFITSDFVASDIKDVVRGRFPHLRFIVADMDTDRAGWLPRPLWNMLNDPG